MMKSSVKDEFGNEESRQAPGRPRSERLDQAIRKAAVDLVLASGFRALSMDAIAAKAGVGRMTIYRRWPNKAAIIMDSFVARVDLGTLFSSASSFKKSIWLLMRTMAKSSQGKDGALIRVLLAEVSSIPNSPRLSGNDGPHREEEWLSNTFARDTQGALRSDIDPNVMIDLLYALSMTDSRWGRARSQRLTWIRSLNMV